MAKMNMILNRDFALAGEIIHDHKVSFHTILYQDDLISCKCFVTYYDDFECL